MIPIIYRLLEREIPYRCNLNDEAVSKEVIFAISVRFHTVKINNRQQKFPISYEKCTVSKQIRRFRHIVEIALILLKMTCNTCRNV